MCEVWTFQGDEYKDYGLEYEAVYLGIYLATLNYKD
jgi:hypothetical protein